MFCGLFVSDKFIEVKFCALPGSWDQFVQSSNEAPKLVENDGWREWPKENPGIALWFDYCRSLRESKSFFPKRDNWKSKSGKPNGVRVRYFHHPLKFGK